MTRSVGRSLARLSVLVAVVCLVVDPVGFIVHGPGLSRPWLLLVIVVVDAALALPAKYSGWVAVAHAVASITIAATLRGTGWDADLAGDLIAGYRAGAWLRGWSAVGSLAALAAGVVCARWAGGSTDWLSMVVEIVKNALLPWLVGRYTTGRRAYIDEMRHRRDSELRDAKTEVEQAVARERTAIARDLHDVISHHVSAIAVHAGAARLKLGSGAQDSVGGSLAAVETASRAAMVDLRILLDVLHGTADTASQPGLDNLEELFDGMRRSGLSTRLSVHGMPRAVPESLDVALYRIAQEMLTNALRHGDGRTVEVELVYADSSVTLSARNAVRSLTVPAGRPPDEPREAGRGLAGIRTRAAMFRGRVTHGPDGDNARWATIVTVPTEEMS